MLREAAVHSDPCDMTMSMMREKQYQACERRLLAHPGVALFSDEATDAHAQDLFEQSCYCLGKATSLITLEELRERAMLMLPAEAMFVSQGERAILERLIINEGELLLTEWDDLGAAESLVRRLWCGFRTDGDDWYLSLPQSLNKIVLTALEQAELSGVRDRCFRYDATIHGLLYLTGLLHSAQALEFFVSHVMHQTTKMAFEVARRYVQASFEYISDEKGDMVLLHPGLADPYQLVLKQSHAAMGAFEMSQTMMAGGMNGIMPQEEPLHEKMCLTLRGALRPELEINEAAEDLRMLAKQGVSLEEMENVLASFITVLPTPEMLAALRQLYEGTPRWLGLKAPLEH